MLSSKIAIATAVLAGLLAGCARNESAADMRSGAAAPSAAPRLAESTPAASADAGSATDAEASGDTASLPPADAQLQSVVTTQQDPQRKFIRTASARFRVRDVYRSTWAIEDLAAQFGGFVTKDAVRTDIDDVESSPAADDRIVELATYTLRADLQVRVPSERTQAFLRALAAQVDFLDNRDFTATDAQFDLLRQQLAFARGQQAQNALGDVAATPGRTADKADALSARADAQAARDEALVAQKEFEDRVAFSTLDLSLYQSPQVKRSERIDVRALVREQRPTFFVRLGHSLAAGWYGLLDALVALAQLWPLWLVLAALAAGLRWWLVGVRRRRQQQPSNS